MLLDTCALLWLVEGGGQLSVNARRLIDAAPAVHVSAITAFEISLKYRSGKLELPASTAEWFRSVVAHHNLNVCPLDAEICIAATELPAVHKDPCDRFIVATARLRHWPVVTGDPRFHDYGIEVIS